MIAVPLSLILSPVFILFKLCYFTTALHLYFLISPRRHFLIFLLFLYPILICHSSCFEMWTQTSGQPVTQSNELHETRHMVLSSALRTMPVIHTLSTQSLLNKERRNEGSSWHSVISPLCVLVTQLCPTLCNPMDCSLPGSSVHGMLQERILE